MTLRSFIAAVALLIAAVPAHAQNITQALATAACGTPGRTITAGSPGPIFINTSGYLCVTGTITTTPSGTQDVNITQILGAAPSATNPIWVAPATASTPWIVAGGGTAGTAATGVVTIQGISSMTPVQVSQATASNLNATVVGTGTFAVQATIAAAPLQPIGITPTDRTVTSATGASQTVMALNASRHSMQIVNTGNANCGVNPTGGTAVIGGAGTITLAPLGSYSPRVPTLSAVTAICTSGQPLYADEN